RCLSGRWSRRRASSGCGSDGEPRTRASWRPARGGSARRSESRETTTGYLSTDRRSSSAREGRIRRSPPRGASASRWPRTTRGATCWRAPPFSAVPCPERDGEPGRGREAGLRPLPHDPSGEAANDRLELETLELSPCPRDGQPDDARDHAVERLGKDDRHLV